VRESRNKVKSPTSLPHNPRSFDAKFPAMAGFGTGGPRPRSGKRHTAEDLCETYPRLNVFQLHRAQALYPGARSAWRWPDLTIGVHADTSGITITDGEREQRVAIIIIKRRCRYPAVRLLQLRAPLLPAVLAGCPVGVSDVPPAAACCLACAPLEADRACAYA
jgi:hypothetical protein